MEEQDSNGGLSYFRQGANVEVLSKEKGSEGAWFPASVLEPPATRSASKRKSFTSNKVLIQYKTLVSEEDPTKLHVEYTTVSLLRPAPPADNAEERFEQNDVVDAFDLDGWWTGVVMEVVGEKYTVGFKKPPDLLEVERSELRSHWDWDHGVWTRAPKEVMGVSNYMPGTGVEVNLKKDDLWFSWLPAIYLGQVGSDSFFVQYRYETLENVHENGLVKVVVADHQIRPRPPQQEKKDFHLLQMVDAFFDKGWWVGEITEVLANDKYVVTFKFTKEVKEFCHSDLRCHLEWIDKQWMTRFSEFHSLQDYGGQLRHARESSSKSVGKRPSRTKCRTEQLSLRMDQLPCGNPIDKLKTSRYPKEDSTFLSPTPCKKLKGEDSQNTSSLVLTYRRRTPAKTSKRKGLFTDQEEIKHDNGDGVNSGIVVGKEKPAELLVQHSKYPAAGGMNDKLEKPASLRWNQNLVTYQRKRRFKPTGVKHNRTGVVINVEVSKTNVVEHIGNPVGTINRQEKGPKLPFTKGSPLWEHFESMEVFKNIPQKPHFHPVLKKKDVYREELAIGSMVDFASLVEKISGLRVDDPREVIVSCMEGLAEMESMGFDVKAIRHHLTELLDMKVKFGQLQLQSKEVKIRITRKNQKTITYEETITAIDKKIKDLQEKRMMAVSKKEFKVSEISRLQAEATAINEDIQNIRCDFGKLVALW